MLVVDDDEVCRLAAVALLETLGLTADVACDGRDAINMSRRWRYAAIFMDCGMPRIDGYTAARQIRRRDGVSAHTLVIAMTSHPSPVCFASGMDHYLAKPLQIDALRAACTRLGLLARDGMRLSGRQPLAADTPLLKAHIFKAAAGPRRIETTQLSRFIEQTIVQLPDLWTAANAGDGPRLHRIAQQVRDGAVTCGAARIADLSDRLLTAATTGNVTGAGDIEPELRQAIGDTAAALRTDLAGAAAAVVGVVDPTELRALGGVDDPEGRLVRVAVADDDPLARLAIEAMIERADGLALVGGADGVDAIAELAAIRRPDVVVLDWMMPGGGGPEAARRILERNPETLIVGLTSDTSEALVEMVSAGAACVVAKGGSGDQLAQTIKRAVRASA